MSHLYGGSLITYNSLLDKHLTGYFNNTRIRRHLRKAGLITRSGRIISEKEYRLNAMRRDHQRYVQEFLAQAIFHKVLDMERHHQLEIRRKLDTFARREQVYRMKADHLRRTDEDIIPLFSPCPPAGPRSSHGCQVLAEEEQSESTESSSSPRPKTAPANMQRPTRLQPLHNTAAVGKVPKSSTGTNQKNSAYKLDHRFPRGVDKDILKLMRAMDQSTGPSPYQLPIINNYVTPVPPPPKRSAKNEKGTRNGTRGRRLRSATAPNELDQLSPKDLGKFHKISVHSNVTIKMVYLGRSVHLSHDDTDNRDEIKALQQHCGGENLCVYKGKLLEGESFQFTSRRHRGFPFSLTFYLNGLQVDRISSCCEYRHRRGARLGGKHGYFRFVSVEGASPCYRCIIAMGLDKKPTPPPKKQRKGEESKAELMDEESCKVSKGEEEEEMNGEKSVSEKSDSSSSCGSDREMIEDKTAMKDGEAENEETEGENDQGESTKDEYEEDFEAYEEKLDEKTDDRGQVDEQRDGMSDLVSGDEKDGLDQKTESKILSQRASEASDVSEKDKSDRYSDSESEQEDKQGNGKATDGAKVIAARKIQRYYYRKLKTHQKKKSDRKKRSTSSSCSTLYSSTSGDESEVENLEDNAKGTSNKATHKDYEKQPELCSDAEREAQINSMESTDENSQRQDSDSIEEEEPEVTTEKTMLVEDVPMKDLREWQLGSDGTRGETYNLRLIENGTVDKGEENTLIPTEEDRTEREYELEGIKIQESFEVDDRSDCKLVQEKIAKEIVIAEDMNSEPEPSDSSTDEDDSLIHSGYGLTERKVGSEEEWMAEEVIVSKTEKFAAQPKVDETLKESSNMYIDIKNEATEKVFAQKSGSVGMETAQIAAPNSEGMAECLVTAMPVDVEMLKETSYEGVENATKELVMAEAATKEAMTNGNALVEKANGLAGEPKHEYGKIPEETVLDRVSEAMFMEGESSETILKSEIVDGHVTVEGEEILVGIEHENAIGATTFVWGEEVVEQSTSKRERRETAQREETAEEVSPGREESVVEKTCELAEVPVEANQGIEINSGKGGHELQETGTNKIDELRTSTARTELELMLDEASCEREGMPSEYRMTEEIVVDNTPCGVDVHGDKTYMSDGEEIAVEAAFKLQELVEEAALKGDKTMEEDITEKEVMTQETATEVRKSMAQEVKVARDEDTPEKVVAGEGETVKEDEISEEVISEPTELKRETAAAEALSNGEYVEEEAAPEKEKLTETVLEFNEKELAKEIEHECEKESMEAAPEEQETEVSVKLEEAEAASKKVEMGIEEAAAEEEGGGTIQEFKSTSDEMSEQEEAVSQSDEVAEETPTQTEKEAEGTMSDTEEEGKIVVPEKEEGISEREEEVEKVAPERVELSEEGISERDKEAEKIILEREEVAGERTPEREEAAEKVVPKTEEEEGVTTEEDLAERKPLKEGIVSEEEEKASIKMRVLERQNAAEALILEAMEERTVPDKNEATNGIVLDEEKEVKASLEEEKELTKKVEPEYEELAKKVAIKKNTVEEAKPVGEEGSKALTPEGEFMAVSTSFKEDADAEGKNTKKDVKAEDTEHNGEEMFEEPEYKHKSSTKEIDQKGQEAFGKTVLEGKQVDRVTCSLEQQLSDQAEVGECERKEALIEKAASTEKLSAEKEVVDDEHLGPEETAPNIKKIVKETSEIEVERLSKRWKNTKEEEQIVNKDVARSEKSSVEETLSCSENKGDAELNSLLKDLSDIKKEEADTSQQNQHEAEMKTDED
ncbi:glutamate-rich protein 3 [Microcaecilia unicolor]|uniref:Glutamate-rich protein 3 n=1 Tax=Microcaecilia unicolor TaxID=1415580 RepID=A0A6P7YKQ5_9AMPH|nr:glutamate-rich protein 3 [Microcaecilia unicolor]